MTSVLIVEDEESLADPLAFLLRKEGFEATVVADQFDPINDNNVDEVEPVPRVLPGATVVPIDALWARLALMGLMLGISVLYLRRRG